MMERVFDDKDSPDEKKVKLVALKPSEYASISQANTMAKPTKRGKGKICSWDQMRDKLKAMFLLSHHLHDNDALGNAV